MATLLISCPQCMVFKEQADAKTQEIKVLEERVSQLEHKLQDVSREKGEVEERLNDKLLQLNDNAIKIRSLEEQLHSALDRGAISELSRAEVDGIISRDLERIHSQLVQKDVKIMELNNMVLEKERHILDLQEMCREQGELVQAKAKAFHIIQQKLLDLNSRTTREDSTETEAVYFSESPLTSSPSTLQQSQKERRQRDSSLPGHAVIHFKIGSSGSPPPVDPSEECSSITQETSLIQDDLDVDDIASASSFQRKKQRKKVTFDLPPHRELKNGNGAEVDDDIAQAIIDLTTENDQLRKTIQEMESYSSDVQNRTSQLEIELNETRRDSRNQVLKARASMQGRIRDLEDKIQTINAEHAQKVEHLNASIETLRSDREWTLEENARLLKLLSSYKEKLNDTWEALDGRQTECEELRSKLDDDRVLVVRLADDLEEAQHTANVLLEQKISILDDVERLKEALEAQDQYIELLEADTVIYEEHIGLLRDSLGASKVERRALIKSKAFEAKLKALEQEKEQMNRRRNDERLHIKALNLKISSLEAEKTVLTARNDELESRLAQLTKNVAATTSTTAIASNDATTETSGNTFRPVHTQTIAQQMVTTHERRASDGAAQWLEPGIVAAARGYHYSDLAVCQNRCDDDGLLNDMRRELDGVRAECSQAQEKIVQMGCVNFELENQLKEAKEKLEDAEIRRQQAEQQAAETRRNCTKQKEEKELVESEFVAKLTAMEKEMNELKEELTLKNDQLKATMIENNKRHEEMKQWLFAVDEMEAVHLELQTLEKQLNDEKAAMESKWAEVRAILLEREGDMSRKTSNAESVTGGEQSTANQLKHLMDTISELKNTVNEQTKKLERDKAERRKFKAAIRQLQADKESLRANSAVKAGNDEEYVQEYRMQIAGLQRQRDFMDNEMSRLFVLNNSKDDLIQKLQASIDRNNSEELTLSKSETRGNSENKDKDDRILQLRTQIEVAGQEKTEISDLLEKRNVELEEMRMHAERLQMDYQQLQLQLQFSLEQNQKYEAMFASTGAHLHVQQQVESAKNGQTNLSMAADGAYESINMEMREQMEKLTLALQHENSELQKAMHENEALKLRCEELTAALHSVSGEMERRSQEKDDIIEMLQSQHTYLTQIVLRNEKHGKHLERTSIVTESANLEMNTELQDASVNTEAAAASFAPTMQHNETQTVPNFTHPSRNYGFESTETEMESVAQLSRITEAEQKQRPEVLGASSTSADDSVLASENLLLRQCVSESNEMQDNLTDDIKQLMILNAELETAVEVLKGEIWALNEQLKASLADREDLSDKLLELSQRHQEDIVRARERERDLEEQKDMAERSQRQAALAENESNRRLVEWQEKSSEMESSRMELENAYAQLSEYYQQLQQAYNALYARVHSFKVENSAQTVIDGGALENIQEIAEKVEHLKKELEERKMELNSRAAELQHIRDLLQEHLRVALKNIKDLRDVNLKLLKDFIAGSVQTIRTQLGEASEEVRIRAEEAIAKWIEEKVSKDAEIAEAVQQLVDGILAEGDFSRTANLALSDVVDAVRKEFAEKECENASLKKDLRDERNDKIALEMKMQQIVFERDEESVVKVRELEDLLQATQLSLTEHVARCQQLQAKLDELGAATGRNSPTAAARLTTKIADNDALFRCNAELAQTNLRLQNEIDELKEQIAGYLASTGNKTVDSATVGINNQQQLFQPYAEEGLKQIPNQSSGSEEGDQTEEWTWEVNEEDSNEKSNSNQECQSTVNEKASVSQETAGSTKANEDQKSDLENKEESFNSELECWKQTVENLEKKLHETKESNLERGKKIEKLQANIERLEKRLEASEEYCLELETKVEGLETELERSSREVAEQKQKLQETLEDGLNINQTTDSEELMLLKNQNKQLEGFVEYLNKELEGMRTELKSAKLQYENEKTNHEISQARLMEELRKQKDPENEKDEEKELESDWNWDTIQLPIEEQVENLPRNEIQNPLLEFVQNPAKEIEFSDKNIQTVTETGEDRNQLLQEWKEQLQQKEIQMQELENENKSLGVRLESQQRLIESLEKKLDVTEEYVMELETKSENLEQQITDQKKKYENLLAEKNKLVENEVIMKLQEEIVLLKEENETSVAESAKKQASLDREKTEMQTELVSLEQQLTDRNNVLENLTKKLQQTLEENTQLQRQLDDCSTQMDDLRKISGEVIMQKNEADHELQQQLDEAVKKITKLKERLDEVEQQNELLKDSEQKLMDSLSNSNEQLVKIDSENKNLKSEIVNLQVVLLEAEETAKKTNSERPAMKSTSTMTDLNSETLGSSTNVLSNTTESKDYRQIQKKMDELKQKFKETIREKALAEERAETMQRELSALKKERKKPLPSSSRLNSAASSMGSASYSAVNSRETNEIDNAASNGRSREGSLRVDEPFEPALQRTIQQLQQVSDDKLRRRKGGGGGFRGAEKL